MNIASYTIDGIKTLVEKKVQDYLGQDMPVLIEYPPGDISADLAVPCFPFAKVRKTAPQKIAAEIAERFEPGAHDIIEKTETAGGYLNITLNLPALATGVFEDLDKFGGNYGDTNMGKGRNVVIDYSHPNIAKPFSVGNVRSSIIGQAVYNIYRCLGYNSIGVNHLGDWGTQFGKLIYAYQSWGNEEVVKQNPIPELLKLYVRFHAEAKENPVLEDEGRRKFRMLEEGDEEINRLWKWFVQISLDEFKRIYEKLGMEFDYYTGESFYNDKIPEVVQLLEKNGIGERDGEGAMLVRLDKYGIETPMLVIKSDGASLYATRDLAALIYRTRTFDPELLIYVVGNAQKLHFQQCFKTFELLGFKTRCVHVDFGIVSLKEGKMSTREGRVVFFEDLLNEGIQRAREILNEKRPDLSSQEREEIARIVAVGAIKFNDLSQNRTRDIVFDWDKMLSFEGDSAPYLQYSYARCRSIQRKSELPAVYDPSELKEKEEKDLVFALARFPEVVRKAGEEFGPHNIAQYLLDIARLFSGFYTAVPVLKAKTEKLIKARLGLVKAYSAVIRRGLAILGIETLERM